MLAMLAALLFPPEGEVKINHTDLAKINEKGSRCISKKRDIGFSFR